jgi:Zn-dependent peptidase ImmA (M78 family)
VSGAYDAVMVRVPVEGSLLRWAQERSRVDRAALLKRFAQLPAWERGAVHPTLRQLEGFARATYTPIGYFFLGKPPEEQVPIPDMRTIGDREVARPSANLLDTIYQCQERQSWYRDHALLTKQPPVPLVDSLALDTPVEAAAATLRRGVGLNLEARRAFRTWEEALRAMVADAEDAGVLVMISGIVGSNTHRPLDPDEFRGFALVDRLAPLVFVNGASSRSAQMFTLAHELAHVALGEAALSDADPGDVASLSRPRSPVERWCNGVAAELLVPMRALTEVLVPDETLSATVTRLARTFKVSTLVILRRLHEAEHIGREAFWSAYQREVERLKEAHVAAAGDGGNFYATQSVRVSRRFASALVVSALEGTTLYREAMRLVGVRKLESFQRLGRHLGVGG